MTTTWLKQAREAIAQGQTIRGFVLHAAIGHRSIAFKAYKLAQRQMIEAATRA